MQFLIFLLPWLELFTLIQLGVETSALTALAYVLVTLMLGIAILRRQGLGIIKRLRQAQQGRLLAQQLMLDEIALGFAGLLLIIPGMITDLASLLLVIGPLRRRLARILYRPRAEPYAPQGDAEAQVTLEGQYRRLDDEEK